MTDEEYTRVRDIGRLDVVMRLVGDLMPGGNVPKGELCDVVSTLNGWYEKLLEQSLRAKRRKGERA